MSNYLRRGFTLLAAVFMTLGLTSTLQAQCIPYTIPYFEGFESGFTDQASISGICLEQESVTGTQVWTANNTQTSFNRSPRTGGWNAYLRYGNEDWIFIPVSLTANTTYNFSAYARQDGSNSSNSDITVAYGTSAASASMSNSIVATTGIVNGNYQEIAGGFTPTTTGVYYVGINGYMNGSPWYISLDDISITAAAANDAVATSITNALACVAGADSVAVEVSNNGTSTITSLPISTSINGGTFSSAGTFTVNIPFGNSQTVMIPVTAVSGTNNIIVATNLTGDNDNTNDTISASYFKGNVELNLTIESGDYGGEVYWALVDSATGTVIDNVGPNIYANNTTYNYTYCLDSNATYTFNAYDDWGDGWNGGTYTFSNCSGLVIVANNGGAVPSNGTSGAGLETTENFTIPSSCPSCSSPSTLTATNITTTSADLGWTENGTATSWQIEYGTTGFTQGTGTMSVVTSNPASISGLAFETNYDFYVRAICGAGDTSVWSGVGSFYTGYCTASPSSVDGSGITNVSMDTLSNTTTAEPGNYGNYSSMVAVAGQGGTLPISITLATGYTYDMWAWVDWNDDLDFSDPGEEYFLGTSASTNPTVFSSSIAIPSTATLGNHRIRIGGADMGLPPSSPPNPCYTGSYASFEDYTLNIVPLEQIDLTITWDEISTVDYSTVAFEGGISAADVDPLNSTNNVLRFVKPLGAQPWAGVTLSTTAGLANPIPFTTTATTVSAKIYSPAAGLTIMMKTEVVGSPSVFAEASATTNTANGWQTLVFDFGNPSNGSINLANNYALLSFFPDFLSTAAGDTFYVDSVYFGGVVPTYDASITSLSASAANTCSSADTLMMVIENFGNSSISNFDIIGNQNGGQNDTLTYTNTIVGGGIDTVYFPVTLVPGNNTFNAYTFVTEDLDVTNDSNTTSIFYSEVSTTASSIDVACPESTDGLAAVTVDSGGVAPFTYMWSDANMTTTNTIQNLAVGNYSVTTTDANGCEFVDNVSILALNGTPSVSITGADTICGDGSSTLDAGAGFDAYAWGSGATTQTINVTSTATYMVTITDTNGCVNDASFDVFAYDLITLTTSGVDVTCEGGTDGVVAATATGGTTTFNYEWSDGAQVSSNIDVEAGTYTVTVTDGSGCNVIDSITIGFLFSNPAFTFAQANVAGEASVVVNAGGSFSDYDWSNGANTAEVTFTTSGTYTLTVTDTNGCSTSDVINVEIWPLGVNQVEATTMSVYPNPSTGIFNLTLGNVPADQVELVVLNVNGQVVTTSTAAASNGIITDVIDLGNAASGIYFLQVNINGSVSTLRLNVQ
jgi:hypothetical protein